MAKTKANLLRAALAEKGMTQGELAKMVGMSANSMSRKIKGKREFTVAEADKISCILNIPEPGVIFLTESSQIRNEKINIDFSERSISR